MKVKVSNLKLSLLEATPFVTEKGKFDLNKAMDYCGKIGGICYNDDGLMASFAEKQEATDTRIERTTLGEHQSIYDHVNLGFYVKDSSKMLNMVLNNEGQYNTSERSLRYTTINAETTNLTDREIELYDKWTAIITNLVLQECEAQGKKMSVKAATRIAQENARYMASVFVNTEMVHTIPLGQLNRIVSYMKNYMNKPNKNDFEERLSKDFEMFVEQCKDLNVLDERLQSNRKERTLRIFGEDLRGIPNTFGFAYNITYQGTYAEYAQKERHRIEKSKLERNPANGFYVPKIIKRSPELTKEWLADIESVAEEVPQGEIVDIFEDGDFDTIVAKLKERACSHAQLEIFEEVDSLVRKYYEELEKQNHPYAKKLLPYVGKRKCEFPDYTCNQPCDKKPRIW